MAALPQLMELPELPNFSVPRVDDLRDEEDATFIQFEEHLLKIGNIVDTIENFVAWLVQLDLEEGRESTMDERRVAHHIAGIERLFEFEADWAYVLRGWDEGVDEKGNWRGPVPFGKSQARWIKKLNWRHRKLDRRIRKLTKYKESDLVANLLVQVAKQRELTREEKIQLLHTIPFKGPIDNPISMKRADWYE